MSDDNLTQPVSVGAWVIPALIHGVFGLAIFARLLVSGPRYAHVFDEFNLKLPLISEAFVTLAMKVESDVLGFVILLKVVWAMDVLVLWLLGGWSRFEGQVWFWVGVAILLITWGLMEVSFLLPYYK